MIFNSIMFLLVQGVPVILTFIIIKKGKVIIKGKKSSQPLIKSVSTQLTLVSL